MKELDELLKKVEELSDFAHKIKLLTNLEPEEFLGQLIKYGLANEPQKVKVPAFVAEWYEMNKKNLEYRIWNYIQTWNDQRWNDFKNWMNKNSIKSLEILTKMQYGYEVEESKWVVNEGDLVIRKGEHEAKVYFVESVDDDGILLVNGIKDEFFTDLDERSVGEESINYFYENFRLLAKKENLEVEKVAE